MSFPKVRPGDAFRPSASLHNATIDAISATRGGQSGASGQEYSLGGVAIVTVSNSTGVDLERFNVVGITGPVFSPADNEAGFQSDPIVDVAIPSTGSHVGKFAIMLEPIKVGGFAKAMLAGVIQAKVNVSQTTHGYADVADSQVGYLASGPCGASQILWVEAGTGVKWAIVRLAGRFSEWQDHAIFAVTVVKDGGLAGNKTTQCSFTYTTKDLDGVAMKKNAAGDPATGMTPAKTRPATGKLAAPPDNSYGLAFWDGTDLVLFDANETLSAQACS